MSNHLTATPSRNADIDPKVVNPTGHVPFAELPKLLQGASRLLTLAILLTVSACGSVADYSAADAAGGIRPRNSPTLISFQEMQRRGQHSSLYVLIQDLRPRWLRAQGPDTFLGPQGQVQVHMDGNHLGSVDVLRRLSSHGVTSIEWLPPIAAGARYGLNHSHGAVVISTTVVH